MLALHSPYPPREREGYCLNTSSPHRGFLSFSPSHLLQTTSPGRRKGYEELLGCQEQEIAGTNCRSPGWPRWLCRVCPLPSVLVPLTEFPFPPATEQALPTGATALARAWVQVEATRPLPVLPETAGVWLRGYIKEVSDCKNTNQPQRDWAHSTRSGQGLPAALTRY